MHGILDDFEKKLSAENDGREGCKKNVDQLQNAFKPLKGRVGAMEANIKSMQTDIGDINMPKQEDDDDDDYFFKGPGKSNANELQSYFSDKVEELECKLNITMCDVRELQDDAKAQGTAVNNLQLTHSSQPCAPNWKTNDFFRRVPALAAPVLDDTQAAPVSNGALVAPVASLSTDDTYDLPFMKANILSDATIQHIS